MQFVSQMLNNLEKKSEIRKTKISAALECLLKKLITKQKNQLNIIKSKKFYFQNF